MKRTESVMQDAQQEDGLNNLCPLNKKVLPFLIETLMAVHGNKPFWVSEKDHQEFNTHPKLKVLRHVNNKSKDPLNSDGYLLVQFED